MEHNGYTGPVQPQRTGPQAPVSPFEEPAEAPELRSARSENLYRRSEPFWSPVVDRPDPTKPPKRSATYWDHPEKLDHADMLTVDDLPPGKKVLRFLGSGTAKIIAAAAVVLCLVAFILHSALLTVHEIRVVGASRFSEEEIIRLSGLQIGQSTWNLDDEAVMHRLQSNRYLRCTLVDVQMDRVTIHIRERVPVGYMEIQGIRIIMDNRGFVLEEAFSAEQDMSHLTQVNGMKVRHASVGLTILPQEEKQLALYEQIVIELAAMSDGEILSALDLAKLDSITLTTRDGFTARLGNEDKIHEKLRAFLITRERVKEMGHANGIINVSDPGRPTFLPEQTQQETVPSQEDAL